MVENGYPTKEISKYKEKGYRGTGCNSNVSYNMQTL